MKEKILKSPILQWIFLNQPTTGKELSELTGIAQQTLSDARTGRSDMSSAVIWKLMVAIAEVNPSGSVAKVVDIIQGKKNSEDFLLQIENIILAADDRELEQIFLFLGNKLFSKNAVSSSTVRDLQSTHR